jgi:organic radical activating enzyme
LKLHNIRAGFATNSSSSHSIVMIPTGKSVREDEHDRFRYGWEQFTLTTRDAKTAYFAEQLWHPLTSSGIEPEVAIGLLNSWLGTGYTSDELEAGYVDHQSTWGILRDDNAQNSGFVQALYNFVMRDDVVILGGNDNSDGQEPPEGSYRTDLTDGIMSWNNKLVRQDGEYWTLFDRTTGNKVRLSTNNTVEAYTKSTYPELVDIHLTSFCRAGCTWCYQASTKDGQHGDRLDILRTIAALSQMGVFEIAYGGGEPTDHPNFAEIIRYTKERGIVPNFTTYSVKWTLDPEIVKAVSEHVGAIGVSVHNEKDLNKVNKIGENLTKTLKAQGQRYVRVPNLVAQHVVGSVGLVETANILERCWEEGIHVLLLGYKNVGFGSKFTPHDMEGIDTILRLRQQRKEPSWNANFSMLGVDTAFVQQFGSVLDELEIPKVLVTSDEGKFSMYIDAVKLTQGPSSYMPERMEPFDVNNAFDSIALAYKNY